MKRNPNRIWTSWALALMMMLVSVFLPLNIALAAKPATLNAEVIVTGVSEGGTINGSENVAIRVDFPVPVIGDDGTDYFEHGDEVTLLLSESFKFDPVPTGSFDLMYGAKKLGTVTLSNNASEQAIATITFDGDEDVFDPSKLLDGEPPYSGVSGTFMADLKYNGNHDTDGNGNKTVRILGKTYKLQLPGDIITYTVQKSVGDGAIDLDAGTIEWTVTITATRDTEPDPIPIDLAGYVFEDDLSGVGAYVTGSFSLSGGTLVVPDPAGTPPTTKLAYTFPAASVSPQTITFKTDIPADKLTAGGSIVNDASLYLDDVEVGTDDATATIIPPGVTKRGVASDVEPGDYTGTDRTITWYIDVDNQGRTLEDLMITDGLESGLTLVSAQWQRWVGTEAYTADSAKVDANWADVVGISWTGPTPPTDNIYAIDSINYIGRLKIVTNVLDDDGSTVAPNTFYNQATANWTGSGGTTGSATTGNIGVGVGYDALTKTGAQVGEDKARHQITWTVNVDLRNQSISDFKVYDLFVHDAATSDADLTSAEGWPSGVTIGSSNITRNNGQKFVEISSQDSHLTVNPISLQKDGNVIATLVETTGLRTSGSNGVVLKSQVLDPDIIAGNNAGQKVLNTAAIYRESAYRGQAVAEVPYGNNILAKELLNRAEVGSDNTTGTDSINANNRTINVANGFHYGYKEVIFRLNVNAAGVDFPNVTTSLAGGFGHVTVTDTLPSGWEFAQFSGGQDYLIYNTTGTLSTGGGFPANGSLTTTGSPLSSVSGLTVVFATTSDPHTAAFTFTGLDQPYVILLKARPTADTFDGYLKGADTRNVSNGLRLSSANWEPGKSVSQNVRMDSTILSKNLDLSKQNQGILTWTVKYTPFGQEIGTGLEDALPQGIDLRTDSSGRLIWEQDGGRNINVRELTLKTDGSGEYVEGSELALDVLQSAISYNNDTRKLTFTFPDKTRAYQLTYVTDITGMPGTVTNGVKLVDADGTGTSKSESVAVTAQQGMATMGRSGYLVLRKTNMTSGFLPGAKFTLYNTNADGSKGSARAERITNSEEGLTRFYGLAPGNYILVETDAPSGYEDNPLEYNVVVGSDLKTTVNGSSTITNDNPFVVVNYREADQVGSLTITKTVAGNGADTNKAFDFTLTLTGAPGSYTYFGYGVPSGTIASGDTFSLAHGQSITITGLPAGTTYTVAETDYSGDGYATTSTGATGSIVTNTMQAATFTNTRTAGNLTIRKAVAGNAAETDRKFEFTVTLSDTANSYPYIGANGGPSGSITGSATIELADGESVTITGVPKDTTYSVVEKDYSGDGYVTVKTGEAGVIVADVTAEAVFTNTRNAPGSLTISKAVTGNAAEEGKKFEFTITLSDTVNTYMYTGANGAPSGTIEGSATIELAGGQSITIASLREGTTYQVVEKDYSGEGYTTAKTGDAGRIETNGTYVAAFTNTKNSSSGGSTGGLTISKRVAGNGASATKKFEFTVTFNAAGTYSYSGNGVPSGTIESGGRISLAHGQSITIKGLPKGTAYTVTEADYTVDGYIGTSTGETGVITGGMTKAAAFTNTRKTVTPGALMIRKTVVGDDYSKSEVFTFVVTFDANGRYPYSGSKTGTIASGESIRLSHGESVEIMGLPAETPYRVTEREANHNGYYTSATGAAGNVSASGSIAAFVNTRMSVPKTGGNGSMGGKIGIAAFTVVLILLSAHMSLRTKKRPNRR